MRVSVDACLAVLGGVIATGDEKIWEEVRSTLAVCAVRVLVDLPVHVTWLGSGLG